MTRLVHSTGGLIRSLQMSSDQFFAFVEGRLDRVFFDKLLSRVVASTGVKYQVMAMKELPESPGGKAALLSMFQDFRQKKLLRTCSFGKNMALVFLADKDADDYCGKLFRSAHLIYSECYDLEAHLVMCADLHRGLAESCGITLTQAKELISNPKTWITQVVKHWRHWVTLCLISQANSADCGCTYSRVSQVNPNPLTAPDPKLVEKFKALLAIKLAIDRPALDKLFDEAIAHVDKSLANDLPMQFFKGKWLSHVMQKHLETQVRPEDANFSGVWERLLPTLLAQVALGGACNCCAHYEKKLVRLVSGL